MSGVLCDVLCVVCGGWWVQVDAVRCSERRWVTAACGVTTVRRVTAVSHFVGCGDVKWVAVRAVKSRSDGGLGVTQLHRKDRKTVIVR